MTLVLKSNVKMSTGNLKSKIALQPIVAADFVGETYLVNGNNVGINDVVTVTNNKLAGKLDAFGNFSEVSSANVPVIGFNPDKFKKGLQIEPWIENFFINGKTNPQSFERKLVINPQTVPVLSVIGEGYATLAIDGEEVGRATEGKPFVFISDIHKEVTVAVTVVGNLEFGGLYRVSDARPIWSRYGEGPRTQADTVSVKSNLLQLLTNMEGCLVLKNFYPEYMFDRKTTKFYSYLLAQFIDSSAGSVAKGFSLAFIERGSFNEYSLRGYDTEQKLKNNGALDIPPLNEINTIAINFSKTEITAVANGELVGSIQLSEVDIDTINLASGLWGETTSQHIESYMLYNRQLTVNEMIDVTK